MFFPLYKNVLRKSYITELWEALSEKWYRMPPSKPNKINMPQTKNKDETQMKEHSKHILKGNSGAGSGHKVQIIRAQEKRTRLGRVKPTRMEINKDRMGFTNNI